MGGEELKVLFFFSLDNLERASVRARPLAVSSVVRRRVRCQIVGEQACLARGLVVRPCLRPYDGRPLSVVSPVALFQYVATDPVPRY